MLCSPETVLRIASISKSLTMVAVAKLWEEGKLDLDTAVQKYVPEFPEKEYEGEKVNKAGYSQHHHPKISLATFQWWKYVIDLI